MALSSSRGLRGASGAVRCHGVVRSMRSVSAQAGKGRSGQGSRAARGAFCIMVPRGPGNAGLAVGDSGGSRSLWSRAAARLAPSCGRGAEPRLRAGGLQEGPPRAPCGQVPRVLRLFRLRWLLWVVNNLLPAPRRGRHAPRREPAQGQNRGWPRLVHCVSISRASPEHIPTERTQPWRNGFASRPGRSRRGAHGGRLAF